MAATLLGIAPETSYGADWATLETEIGNAVPIVRKYGRADTSLVSSDTLAALAAGKKVLLSLKPVGFTWAQVTAGNMDTLLTAAANALVNYRTSTFLVFHHEMDTTANQSYGTAADYIAAHAHVTANFAAVHSGFLWLYLPTGYDITRCTNYYPGDAQVSYIGRDVYPQGVPPDVTTNPPVSLTTALGPWLTWAQGHPTKPKILGEWAYAPITGSATARATVLAQSKTELTGLGIGSACYFNFNPGLGYDWRFDVGADSANAIAAMASAW